MPAAVVPCAGRKKPDRRSEPPETPVKKTFEGSKERSWGRTPRTRSFTAAAWGTPSVRSRPAPPPQKRFGSGARTATPARPALTPWLGKSKNDWPPSPWRRTLRPSGPRVFGGEAAPGTEERAVKEVAGALTLKRRGRLLGPLAGEYEVLWGART